MENNLKLEQEVGVTQVSLNNAKRLIERFGVPEIVCLYQPKEGPQRGEHLVQVGWIEGRAIHCKYFHTFNGFAWGYWGEGPRGLRDLLTMCGIRIPRVEIAAWPQTGFQAKTFIRGIEIANRKEVISK